MAEVTIDPAIYYGLAIKDRFRFQANATLCYEVVRELQPVVGFYEQHCIRPMDGVAAPNDFRAASTIGYLF